MFVQKLQYFVIFAVGNSIFPNSSWRSALRAVTITQHSSSSGSGFLSQLVVFALQLKLRQIVGTLSARSY